LLFVSEKNAFQSDASRYSGCFLRTISRQEIRNYHGLSLFEKLTGKNFNEAIALWFDNEEECQNGGLMSLGRI
jgi:hypothetical protein